MEAYLEYIDLTLLSGYGHMFSLEFAALSISGNISKIFSRTTGPEKLKFT
jgi:hypothetical protein